MKGVSVILLVIIAILAVITVMGIYLFAISANVEGMRRSIIEREVVAEINKLEFLKRNLHQALDYSFYQATYNISRCGGYDGPEDVSNTRKNYWSNYPGWLYWRICESPNYRALPPATENIPEWRVHLKTFFPDIVEALNKTGQKIFNEYLESLRETTENVSIPNYIFKEINISNTHLNILAVNTSGESIILEKRNIGNLRNLTISDNSTLTEKVKTTFGSLVNFGRDNFVTHDSIGKAIMNTASDAGFMPSGSVTLCGRPPTPDEVFICTHTPRSSVCPVCQYNCDDEPMTISKAEGILKEPILASIKKLESDLSTGGFKVELLTDQKTNFIFLDCHSYTVGCCLECHSENSCCSNACGISCCEHMWKTDCNFYYYGAARVVVNITDTTTAYSVYDYDEKLTDLKNLQLKFYVFPGTLENISPVNP